MVGTGTRRALARSTYIPRAFGVGRGSPKLELSMMTVAHCILILALQLYSPLAVNSGRSLTAGAVLNDGRGLAIEQQQQREAAAI